MTSSRAVSSCRSCQQTVDKCSEFTYVHSISINDICFQTLIFGRVVTTCLIISVQEDFMYIYMLNQVNKFKYMGVIIGSGGRRFTWQRLD